MCDDCYDNSEKTGSFIDMGPLYEDISWICNKCYDKGGRCKKSHIIPDSILKRYCPNYHYEQIDGKSVLVKTYESDSDDKSDDERDSDDNKDSDDERNKSDDRDSHDSDGDKGDGEDDDKKK
jgi:hypothetical protein